MPPGSGIAFSLLSAENATGNYVKIVLKGQMLRHATGYALSNEGTDTRLIQDFLGHASIVNTLRYTKPAPGRLAAVRVR